MQIGSVVNFTQRGTKSHSQTLSTASHMEASTRAWMGTLCFGSFGDQNKLECFYPMEKAISRGNYMISWVFFCLPLCSCQVGAQFIFFLRHQSLVTIFSRDYWMFRKLLMKFMGTFSLEYTHFYTINWSAINQRIPDKEIWLPFLISASPSRCPWGCKFMWREGKNSLRYL